MAGFKVNGYEVREDLYYTKEHEWLKVEEGLCRVGVTDYAQKALQDVVYVELANVGKVVSQMEPIGTIESVKAISDVYAPVAGKVVSKNDRLNQSPELVNKDPYGEGWLVVLEPLNLPEDLKKLLDHRGYAEFLRQLMERKG